jgi:stage II sporulation protein E
MKPQNNKGELLLKGPGREKLMAYAKSFEGLSRSFYFLPDRQSDIHEQKEVPVEIGNRRREALWHSRMVENRMVVADQLLEVSRIITEMADEIGMVEDVGSKNEDKIIKALKREGLAITDLLMIENKDRRLEIYMRIKAEWGNRVASREAAEIISEALGQNMVPSLHAKSMIDKEYMDICFEEEPAFQILTGFAKSTKDHEKESGDTFSVAKINRGQIALSLSDGMGSGPAAAYESKIVIELLEQFLEAGFDTEAAVLMINGAMIGRNEDQIISTLDICRINLYSGMLTYLKAGASTTFIKSESQVEIIESESLPLGIFHEPDFDKGRKKLYDGDIIVMVTDGVLDRIGGEAPELLIAKALKKIKSNNPKEIASKLLKYATLVVDTPCKDDMTILVAGIWRN